MSKQLIECVPNFSEGRDLALIKQITDEIAASDGVKLLDVDPGQATNRTVVTFVGAPEPVLDAAVRVVKKAAELIDMSKHTGEHPRFGATDVCPLVPVSNITMEETVEYARALAKRIGDLGIPVYCYENAALTDERRNLAHVRSGEYEALADKLTKPEWKPDFGPAEFNPGAGATAVSARDFLVAFNANLNTTSTRRANAIAFDVRERGRVKRDGDSLTGPIVKDDHGKPVMVPGSLKCVKGIGWFIEEYGVAQISMNLTNISVTPVHVAFDEVDKRARARGVRVTGSELVGLIPLQAMLDAGKYFLAKQQRSVGIADAEIIKIAVKSMGLDELYPFKPDQKIIEYVLAADEAKKKLVDMTMRGFVEETASESVAPGGGSVAAAMGAMGASLGTMVANLSSHKRGWDERWHEYSDWAEGGKAIQDEMLTLIDADTDAFNQVMAAFRMANKSAADKAARSSAIQEATIAAIAVPFRAMELALASMNVAKAMAEIGNPNSVSDAGVGAMAARSAVMGAFLNVKINCPGVTDKAVVADFLSRGEAIENQAQALEAAILTIVNDKINAEL
jgi:glutamate formiminotransferase/formiminotetrahydrofolate cyclodeaminase